MGKVREAEWMEEWWEAAIRLQLSSGHSEGQD